MSRANVITLTPLCIRRLRDIINVNRVTRSNVASLNEDAVDVSPGDVRFALRVAKPPIILPLRSDSSISREFFRDARVEF